MSNKFIPIDRNTEFVLPADMEGWLAADALARFIVEIVETLDTSSIENAYKGGGSAPYHPKIMLALLFYCYATGIFSSRGMERATYELIPVIFITGNTHPDHNSINTFRKRFLPELEEIFLQILLIAHTMGILKLGDISIDGTKIKANASKHKAMSWAYANKLEAQLRSEVKKLQDLAASAETGTAKKINIPEELERREERLKEIAKAKEELERRAKKRYEIEKAEYEAKIVERKAKEEERGRKLGGRKPKEPECGPRDKDQVNFTDGESRIMPVSGGSFEQTYNAQASVDMDTLLVVGNHITQQPNDKQEITSAVEELAKLPEEIGDAENVAADSGYLSKENVETLEGEGINPYIAGGRQPHHAPLEERLEESKEVEELPEISQDTDPMTAMQDRMKTDEGKAFYARRKSTVEPVFGIIKNVMGFRQFMLRGLNAVSGEWNLVCIAFNLKRICALT